MLGGLSGVGKIPELRRRVLFTLAMLAIYRFGVFVSTPGINVQALREMFNTQEGGLFGMINLFTGGSFENFSIFTLGIMPYITVSIIMQVLSPLVPALAALKKEGESGRKIITRYTRQGTIVLGLIQSYMIAVGLESQGLVLTPGWTFRICAVFTLTAGTAFIMWLGEQINEKGIGNGVSMIIFAGIVARMPGAFAGLLEQAQTGAIMPLSALLVIVFVVLTIAAIVYVERAQRRIPIQYPRRMVGNQMAQAQTQYLPLKVNMAGVIPPIFASALLSWVALFQQFTDNETIQNILSYLAPDTLTHAVVFAVLIIFFCYFYTPVIFNPEELAENLKKQSGFVPTVRPGKPTADYIYDIMTYLTLWGAIYISAVCLIPQFLFFELGTDMFAYVFGGTSILIVISVTLDTAQQIQSYVIARDYEAFMSRSTKKRGGMGSMSYARNRLLKR